MRSHASSSMAWGGASPRPVPTLLTRMSIRLRRTTASRAMAAQSGDFGDVGFEGEGLAAFVGDHADGFFRAVEMAVDAHHVRAFAGEEHGHGAAIADGLARRLSGADDDGGLVCEAAGHRYALRSGSTVWPSSTWMPNVVEDHRDLRVLADGEDEVHALAFGVVLRQVGPDGVGDEVVAVEIVAGGQQRLLGGGPAIGAGAVLDALDLVGVEAGLQADAMMLRPLIAGLAEPADAQDGDLAIARRERVAGHDVAAPPREGAKGVRRAHQRAEDVEDGAILRAGLFETLDLLGRELGVGERRDAGFGQAHVILSWQEAWADDGAEAPACSRQGPWRSRRWRRRPARWLAVRG